MEKLQLLFFFNKNKYKNDALQFISAIKIQSTYRGYIIRKIYANIIKNNKLNLQYNLIPHNNIKLYSNIDSFIHQRQSFFNNIHK
jgi:hypothetical protein